MSTGVIQLVDFKVKMKNLNFTIQDIVFNSEYILSNNVIDVMSSPRPYKVSFIEENNFNWLVDKVKQSSKPLILIDKKVKNELLSSLDFDGIPCYELDATEDNKDISSVLKVCNFLTENNANKGSMLFVIGGGIVQDIGAFCGAMYKRGIPWTFIPTTLLSQSDSCLGGKTAVNFNNTKNVLGLFSAPREVVIDKNFINSLQVEDILSGIGEIYRLLITGGDTSFKFIEERTDAISKLDIFAINELTKFSLIVKKLIVEYDEFELDIRRSMNYGHSIGHALEAASNYAIPHGQAVTIGILVENQISYNRGLLSNAELERLNSIGMKLISPKILTYLLTFDADTLLKYLMNDKKVIGTTLKLATLQNIGSMKFIDLILDSQGQKEISKAFYDVFRK